ncbi:hypothetical protein [Methylocystis echinoides]|uniref:Uncharacterized protein n=1 Tax=Methylocystis echinoides TaxID=29468 RepID=A0A9W6LSF9_9HYPH|nr:hypothetical protein [Methylocystis echinoides]GLI93411.1 hypothetical protein LMG27198_24030 [Methylocystis echinoides]
MARPRNPEESVSVLVRLPRSIAAKLEGLAISKTKPAAIVKIVSDYLSGSKLSDRSAEIDALQFELQQVIDERDELEAGLLCLNDHLCEPTPMDGLSADELAELQRLATTGDLKRILATTAKRRAGATAT